MFVAVLSAALIGGGMTAGATTRATFRGKVAYDVSWGKAVWIEARNLVTGKTTRLTSAAALRGGFSPFDELTWSPDGKRLAYTQWVGVNRNVYVVDGVSAGVTKLTASAPSEYGDIEWSPDGTMLAFSRYKGGGSGVYVVAADGSGLRRLYALSPVSARLAPLAWSEDGSRLAFPDHQFQREPCTTNARVVVAPLAVGEAATAISAQPVSPKSTYEISDVAWQPNGETLLYVVNDTESAHGGEEGCEGFFDDAALDVVLTPGAKSVRIFEGEGLVQEALWSPDGDTIAWTHYTHGGWPKGTLSVMNAKGKRKRVLLSDVWGFGDTAWTDDSRYVIRATDTSVVLRDPTTRRVRPLARWKTIGGSDDEYGEIFAVGASAVSAHAGAKGEFAEYSLRRIVLARTVGRGSRMVTLKVKGGLVGYNIAVALP